MVNGTAPTIRRASNPAFRLVEREDLVAGLELFLVDEVDVDYPWQKIVLDQKPVRKFATGEDYVYYYCTDPFYGPLCFVPLTDFVGGPDSTVGPQYWIEI